MGAQNTQLFLGYGVGPAGLDGVFLQMGEVELRFQPRAEPLQLRRGERGGRAAAEVDRQYPQPQRLHLCGDGGELPLQRLKKRRDQLHALFHGLAHEAAVGAARRAERDAHIEADVLRRHGALRRKGVAARVQAEDSAFCAHVELLAELPQRLLFAEALPLQRAEELAGPHAREPAPGGSGMPRGERGAVHGVLDQSLAFPIRLQLRTERVAADSSTAVKAPPVPDEQAGRRREARAAAEPDLHPLSLRLPRRVDGTLVGIERQQHLLHRIFIFVIPQI